MTVRRIAVSIILALACTAATKPAAPTLSPADQVQYQQKTVEAQVQELQDRMFHLADLTRSAEPDDSARLLMAVRKAREDLILEQVHDVLTQLATHDFSKASDSQQQVLVKLELLKKLLTSTDLDLQMQLDRLRKLTAAIGKLDAAIKEQKRQQKHTGELGKTPDKKSLEGSRDQQLQNHRASEAIAQTLKDLGAAPAAAANTLGGACQDMSLAEGLMSAGNSASAGEMQGQAAAQMQKARDELEKERQKILDDLARQVRKQVVENLQEMLDRQKSVRGATAAIASSTATSEETELRARKLASAESAIVRINQATLELIEETQFSVALPPELKAIGRSCTAVADHLGAGVADKRLVTDEMRIEQDLADLLETFKQLASDPGPGECRGCKGNKNKLLAELRVLRLLQTHVNNQTLAVDIDRGSNTLDDATKSRIGEVTVSQSETHDVAEAIHQELSGG